MRYFKVLVPFFLLALVVCCSVGTVEADNGLKTDLKIITKLSEGGLFTPALVRNNSLVYNQFEFNLYSNINNTIYEIKVENSTIKIGLIENFKDVFYYNMTLDYINLLEIYIGNHTYSYSDVHVVAYSVYNKSIAEDEGEKLRYTKKDFEGMIAEIQMKSFISNLLGVFLAGGIVYYYVTEHKKYLPEVIA